MSEREDSDSDPPEEFTSEQGVLQDEEIRKVQKESKASFYCRSAPSRCSVNEVVRERKELNRLWAQRKTPRPSKGVENVKMDTEVGTEKDYLGPGDMLPDDIVQLLAAREKKVFLSDSEDEKADAVAEPARKKKPKSSGVEPVILKDISPPQCLQNSLEFLKKKKMGVARSSSVLNNSNQALRLIHTSSLLSKK
ncbi:hypothetical protein K2173_006179 [Erythroxylum novogranatense]|uniref:Uncharacterized protein n=1 Tax=Erythroxylum novogranatense TaxID=1862640 RepID=A0AAV8TDQ3_9ROSI|nr:hypothetical protein K2173_006179 [Erythroxylum novogranatense]